jgi:hypothetical protein
MADSKSDRSSSNAGPQSPAPLGGPAPVGVPLGGPAPAGGWADRYGTWLGRVPPASERVRARGGEVAGDPMAARHSAITRSLYSYANFKNWSDKARAGWPGDPAAVPDEAKPAASKPAKSAPRRR